VDSPKNKRRHGLKRGPYKKSRKKGKYLK
jgi:hypothetical protein